MLKILSTYRLQISPRLLAILQALLVTFLWSTSWVFIKFGLADIPALTFAGLRYSLATLCLLPFALRGDVLTTLLRLSRVEWLRLIGLGVLLYTLTQGAQFLALAYLPAMTTSLLLNFSTIMVALLGLVWLAERPTWLQWGGIGLNLTGILLYFYPVNLPGHELFGIAVALGGVLANAGAATLGRQVNRTQTRSPLAITIISMGLGAVLLLSAGVITQGLPPLSLSNWLIIGWLAVVNTAFAFTLWNHTLRQLSAVESSVINSTMLIQIAILAWVFLGERLTWLESLGMVLAALGVLLVQLRDPKGFER